MEELEFDDLIDKEYAPKVNLPKSEIDGWISKLSMHSNDPEMLTKLYTSILMDDNVMFILTRISQNPIFRQHFPEFYVKNKYGESVINCQQNTVYHRYGVFKHTLCTVESVGRDSLKFNAQELKILKWTMLLHDIGKPMAKMINGSGSDSFAGHDDISCEMAVDILDRFSFTDDEKNVILTLIKYHDKFLNEGDLTYDNLTFLAKELGDKRDLFYLLIEVKVSDNKAKSLDVYNRFINVQNKYFEFANEYFGNAEENKMFGSILPNAKFVVDLDDDDDEEEDVTTKREGPASVYEDGGSDVDITEKIIVGLCRDVTSGKRLKCYYQPIIDLKNKVVEGYEVYYKIITDENFSYDQIIKKAKEFERYDKLQQMLFVNSLERFNELNPSSNLTEYINIDARSYKNYVNKSRIFDSIAGKKVVVDFNNFELINTNDLREMVAEIQKVKAKACIDNFESSNKTVRDIDKIEPKVVKYKIVDTDENTIKQIKELVSYCTARLIRLVVFGVDSAEKLNALIGIGVRYVEGKYFGRPTDGLDMTKAKIEELLAQAGEELIC